jgi:hypothetical protein
MKTYSATTAGCWMEPAISVPMGGDATPDWVRPLVTAELCAGARSKESVRSHGDVLEGVVVVPLGARIGTIHAFGASELTDWVCVDGQEGARRTTTTTSRSVAS